MAVKKITAKSKFPNKLVCSACGKTINEMVVLTEVIVDVYSWYINNSKKQVENINGLWKKNGEYFCETCFAKYVKTIEKFYKNCRKA